MSGRESTGAGEFLDQLRSSKPGDTVPLPQGANVKEVTAAQRRRDPEILIHLPPGVRYEIESGVNGLTIRVKSLVVG